MKKKKNKKNQPNWHRCAKFLYDFDVKTNGITKQYNTQGRKNEKKERPYKSAHHKQLRNITFQLSLGRLKIITWAQTAQTHQTMCRYEKHTKQTIKKQNENKQKKKKQKQKNNNKRRKYTGQTHQPTTDGNSKDFNEWKRDENNTHEPNG